MTLSPEVMALHAAWKAAIENAGRVRRENPIPSLAEWNEPGRWMERCDVIRAGWYEADALVHTAFQAMADALPLVSPQDHALQSRVSRWAAGTTRDYVAVRIWNESQSRWYPSYQSFWTSPDGERVAGDCAGMVDDAIDEAARRNAAAAGVSV